MSPFIEVPLETNATAMISEAFAEMEASFPGWEPAPGNPETFLIEAIVSRLVVPLAQLAAQVPDEIFEKFGSSIFQIAPIEAIPATITSTWTMVDKAGYEIPAGTQVAVATSGNTSVGFKTTVDVVIPPGSEVSEAGEVVLEAVEAGTEGNGLKSGATLIDALSFVTSITLVGESTGGLDAEEPAAYLDRLAETLRTLGPHPVIAADVEILARNTPGIARALALDNFDPETDNPELPETWETEKTTTVVLANAEGLPCTTKEKEEVKAELAAKREVNFVFFVQDADYTFIAIHFQVVPAPGFTQAECNAAVDVALTAFVSPQNWGRGGQGSPTAWGNQRILRYQDLVTIVNNVQSCDYYTVLRVGYDNTAERIPNPSFEAGISGWSGVSAGVTYNKLAQSKVWASDGLASLECETTNSSGGTLNARVGTAEGKEGFIVTAGKTYSVKATLDVLKEGGGKGRYLTVTWYKAAGTKISETNLAKVPGLGVADIEGDVEAPAEATFARLSIGLAEIPNLGVGHFYLDNVTWILSLGSTDLTLAGAAPLPRPGRIEPGS